MFISKDETKYLFDQIKSLSKDMSLAASEITYLKAKIKILDAKLAPVAQPKKPKTIAQKKKQAQYMRTYMAKKKAAKLALEQA